MKTEEIVKTAGVTAAVIAGIYVTGYLGDLVLDDIFAHELYEKFPDERDRLRFGCLYKELNGLNERKNALEMRIENSKKHDLTNRQKRNLKTAMAEFNKDKTTFNTKLRQEFRKRVDKCAPQLSRFGRSYISVQPLSDIHKRLDQTTFTYKSTLSRFFKLEQPSVYDWMTLKKVEPLTGEERAIITKIIGDERREIIEEQGAHIPEDVDNEARAEIQAEAETEIPLLRKQRKPKRWHTAVSRVETAEPAPTLTRIPTFVIPPYHIVTREGQEIFESFKERRFETSDIMK